MRWNYSYATIKRMPAIEATDTDDLCKQLLELCANRQLMLFHFEVMTDQVDVYQYPPSGRRRRVATYMPE